MQYQATIGGRIGKVLVKLGFLDEEALAQFLAREYNHTYLAIDDIHIDHQLISKFSEDDMRHKKYFPIKKNQQTLHLAMSDPMDITVTDNLSLAWGRDFKIFMVSDHTVEKVLRAHFKGVQDGINFASIDDDIRQQLKEVFKKNSEKRILYSLIEVLGTQGIIEIRDLVKQLK